MSFSYTDDAIVSTSPTGRHLSTVIKRPVVLMSGWNEHAEQVCKVLNDLQPDHPVRNLTATGYDWAQFHHYCAADSRKPRDKELDEAVLKLYPDGPTAHDIRRELASAKNPTGFPKPATEPTFWVRVGNCEPQALAASDAVALLTACLEQKTKELTRLERTLAEVKTDRTYAQEAAKSPVEVSTEMAHILYHAASGTTIPANNATRTIKKV